jgi:transcription elongation GreA/GreB family factor
VISAQSPLAAELMNKKPGDTFQMQQQVFRIMNIV